jgi:two-component system, chemotaxis family, sensor kinase CheA
MNQLRISVRLTLILLVLTVPVAVLLRDVVRGQDEQIRTARLEQRGVRWLQGARGLHVSARRLLLGSGRAASGRAREVRAVQDGVDALRAAHAREGDALGFTAERFARRGLRAVTPDDLGVTWARWRGALGTDAEVVVAQGFLRDLEMMTAHVVDDSALILDPDLDTYYLMSAAALRAHEALRALDPVATAARVGATPDPARLEDARARLRTVAQEVRIAVAEDARLHGANDSLQRAGGAWLRRFDDADVGSAPSGPRAVAGWVEARWSLLDALWAESLPTLHQMLDARAVDLAREQGRALRGTGLLAAAALAFALLTVASILRRLSALAATTQRIAEGQRGLHADAAGRDELASLATSFNRMVDAVDAKERALAEANEGLAERVRERTGAIQCMLDAIGDGLLLCDLRGVLLPERSRAIDLWFGPAPEGEVTLWDRLAPHDPTLSAWIRLGYEDLVSEVLPFEVAAAQLPRRLTAQGRTLELEAHAVREGDRLLRVLLTLRDVTAVLAQQEAERLQRELIVVASHALRDPMNFAAFLAETASLLAALRGDATAEEKRRHLHTLKGNTAIYGFGDFATRCHALEGALAEGETLGDAQAAELSAAWDAAMTPVRPLLQENDDDDLRLQRDEYQQFLSGLRARDVRPSIIQQAEAWPHPRVGRALQPLAAQGASLAERLGKRVRVLIDDGGVRLPDAHWRPLFSTLVHVVRNAIDHGVEAPEARVAAGKDAVATLRVQVSEHDDRWVICVSDDGAGIQWEKLRAKAASMGLPHATHDDLVGALFADGVSTRAEVTETSGRGVGMAAVREVTLARGGTLEVHSTPGQGTRIALWFPTAARLAA